MKRYILFINILLLFLLNTSCYADERFVGEFYGAGYYAEVDNITLTEEYLVTKISVKKPAYNKLIEENIRFNRKNNTYEIIKRKIYNYSPRELLEEIKGNGIAMPIPLDSPYGVIMRFVIDWQKRTEPDI
ncbi:MAG: hypothetical protein IKN12_05905 [Selenomonadaceae bacterium]|nr:hypothetical protein [Selenomonadaceae bacterium]